MSDRNRDTATIVVCEDDDTMLVLLCEHLAADGYQPLPAPSVADAIRLCREGRPHLLLVDLALPGGSALDLLRRIRRGDAADPRLPIIVVTARRAPGVKVLALELGADDHLQKPFSYEELRERIVALLRRACRRDHPTPAAGAPTPDTSRPAVAMVLPALLAERTRVCLGYWQPDGGWADAPAGPGQVGLADTIREEIAAAGCMVVCQSFTGEMTTPRRYDAGWPGEEDPIPLPRDPDVDDRDGHAAPPAERPGGADPALAATTSRLIEEVALTAAALEDVTSALLEDLPEGAFPGEDNARVLLDMIVGTVMPATAVVGEETCRRACTLVAAIRGRVLADLHTAAKLAEEDHR